MKQNILVISAAALLFCAATLSPAQAQSPVSNDFTVSVTLSSQCQAVASGTQTLDFGSYSAFQTGDLDATGIDLTFNCTRGLTPSSVAFDTTNGTADGYGVIAGLNYKMEVASAVVTAGTAATTVAAGIGTADVRSYAVTGTMPAEQAGTHGAAASHTRTLIITY